jgi:hypothetical protein
MVTEKIMQPDGVEAYLEAQTPEHGDIYRRLVSEIRRCLRKSTARLYHGSPAWFIVENAVVGVSVEAKAGVTLLYGLRDPRTAVITDEAQCMGLTCRQRSRILREARIGFTARHQWQPNTTLRWRSTARC